TPSMHSHETNRTTHINPPINRVKSLLSPPWSYFLSKATSEGYDTVLSAPFYLNM
ncbi:unnamed protein product, partial [Adineta steineri]